MINDQQQLSAKVRFQRIYDSGAPWRIDRAQPALIALVHSNEFVGPVLDCGCGTGDNSIFLAQQGFDVLGFDFVELAVSTANARATQRISPNKSNGSVRFKVADALNLAQWTQSFETVFDCGTFHVFPDDIRPWYVAGLRKVTKPGGKLIVLCFSEAEPGDHGPLRMTKQKIRNDFSNDDWHEISIKAALMEMTSEETGPGFTTGGAKCWLATFRRKEN